MGTWGTALFSDDLALDIKGEFRDLIAEGVTSEEATARVKIAFASAIADPGEARKFWIILAVVQWSCGRLLAEVKDRALEAIDAGGDLEEWRETSNPRQVAARQRVLEKARQQVCSPQRRPTRIRREFREWTDWEIGHAAAYRLLSGRWTVFRVIAIEGEKRCRLPIVDVAEIVAEFNQLPTDPAELARLPRKIDRQGQTRIDELTALLHRYRAERASGADIDDTEDRIQHAIAAAKTQSGKLALYRETEHDFPTERCRVVATGLRLPGTDGVCAHYFGGWANLDEYLSQSFGLE